MQIKNKPWAEQKRMLKAEPIPEIERVLSDAKDIENPRSATLFCLMYLTACRISEIINIEKKDLIRKSHNNIPLLIISIKNLKNRGRHWKKIPIPLNNKIYIEFYKIIKNYTNTLSNDEMLFNIGKRRAQQIISTSFGINSHLFRHIRLTHLAEMGLTDQELLKYAGWTDSRPAKHYIHMNWRSLVGKL